MSGTIEQQKNGWRYRVEVGIDPGTGKRKWATKGRFKTRRDAQKALNELLVEADQGIDVQRSNTLLGDYLDEWIEGVEGDLRPTTVNGYRRAVIRLKGKLAFVKLQELTPLGVEKAYRSMLKEGLAPKTIRNTHMVLRRALADAERLGLIVRNAAASARPPSPVHHEQETWTAEELNTFFSTAFDHRLFASFVLGATTGMRRGEVLGLFWRDLDLETGRLAVVHTITTVNGKAIESTTKTKKSRRRVSLDSVTLDVLRAHRERQELERKDVGSAWHDTGLVFTREDGTALHPDGYSHMFTGLVRKAGVTPIRLHDLRHTHATLALEAGVHPKIVSERLGHATVGITLDLYSHVTPSMDGEAAEKVASLLQVPGHFTPSSVPLPEPSVAEAV